MFGVALAFGGIALRLGASRFGDRSFFRSRQIYAGAPGLRQADGDGLFGGAGAVLTLSVTLDFFVNKFAGLRRRSFTFSCIFAGLFANFFFGHRDLGLLAAIVVPWRN